MIHDYFTFRWKLQFDERAFVPYWCWTMRQDRPYCRLVIPKAIQGMKSLRKYIVMMFRSKIGVPIRFYLQLKPGGIIRVHTSALQPTSQYKSLVISEETTSDELLLLLLSSYNSIEPVERYSLYEVSHSKHIKQIYDIYKYIHDIDVFDPQYNTIKKMLYG